MKQFAEQYTLRQDLFLGPVTELAEVNPPTPFGLLGPEAPVSFIPMADASESGHWTGRQVRELRQVRAGYTPFHEGDVLFAKITPCMENGKGCHARGLVNGVGAGSTEFHVLRAKTGNDARFIYHWSQSSYLRRAAEAMMTGSAGQRRVPADFFDQFSIPLLSLSEQRRIAEILDTADEAIRKTEALIAKLKQVKAGLMEDLLTRGIDESGQLRDPDAYPEQFVDTALGRVPREREVRTCGSLCREIVVGIVVKPSQYYEQSGVPVLRSANVRETGLDPSDFVFMSERSNRMLAKSMVRAGDVLTVRTGYPGTSCVVPPEYGGANCVDIIVSRPGPEIDPAFLSAWINSDFGKGQVLRAQGGLAQQHFNVGELQKLLVVKPALEEQRRIVAVLKAHDDRASDEQAYLNKLKLLKKGLMEDLLTGRIRVPADGDGEAAP